MPTGFLIPADGYPHRVEVEAHDGSHLASLYEHIECRTVTVITPVRGGALFGMPLVDAWGDDEGLCVLDPVENPTIGMLFGQRVVGNWVITGTDGEGELVDIAPRLLTKLETIFPVVASVD